MRCHRVHYECGAVCLYTADEAVEKGEDMASALSDAAAEAAFALIHFSKSMIEPEEIVGLMAEAAPNLSYAACSTAGELTPLGVTEGQLIVILLPKRHFHVEAAPMTFDQTKSLSESAEDVAAFRRQFLAGQEMSDKGQSFALCITDGMSFDEETVAATLHWGLEDMPLLGGSAGDGLDFSKTCLILNGEILRGGTILLLIASDLPHQVFKTENFVPTKERLVVTRSDPARRIVYELNAENAAEVYAEIIGVDPQSLSPMTFASHPLVVRIGNELYCRSIQKVNDDGSLSFFCAIDDGIVLTVAEPTGMARSTETTLDSIRSSLGTIDFVLGFDCVLRRIDARNRQITQKISHLYAENHVIGFNTYGEQYRSMHLNQTLTGVAFGLPTEKDQATQ
ncbi:FIST N-terminal domain-containing protein [Notoacmeibacter sp. MSK16QG-6]|uniref:FIST N-terminal domain-containing protein n=1 Tax=Notoacmeibacter sp. MSK16QG-6 TaxID=2957982 RepID=UPI00209ED95F|nr:FIST N-terminal domain-containing protein [Notoacmeibacter sp. MSK16QG-6]MCP1200823.1 FIST C-terminal domain-containing protein [Notoacmeibacter sp. MSK16QG-6]